MDRILDTRLWKHYFPTTTVVAVIISTPNTLFIYSCRLPTFTPKYAPCLQSLLLELIQKALMKYISLPLTQTMKVPPPPFINVPHTYGYNIILLIFTIRIIICRLLIKTFADVWRWEIKSTYLCQLQLKQPCKNRLINVSVKFSS